MAGRKPSIKSKSTKSTKPVDATADATTVNLMLSSTPPPTHKSEPAVAKPDGGGVLGRLLNKAKPVEAPAAKKKSTKPIIELDGEEALAFDNFTSADSILKIAEGSQKAAKSTAESIVRAHYFQLCIEEGYKPENPQVITKSSKANYQVKHQNKLKRTAQPNGHVLTVEEHLRQLGFGDGVVSTILEKIVKEKQTLGLKKFTDLMDGNAAQKSVAEKIMGFVETLTEEEQSLVLEPGLEVTVDEGWKDMAVQLAVKVAGGDTEKGVDALSKLYSVIPVQFVLAQIAFSGQLTDALTRLSAPPAKEKVIEHGNGKYIAVARGVECTLYVVKSDAAEEINGKKVHKMGTKTCTSAGHAEASAKKWFREPESLNEALAEFSLAAK
jgi:hypothetical protein